MDAPQLTITYIGGPTVLLEFGGLRFLTDPAFDPAGTEYPSGAAKLRKLAGPALPAQALGAFDYVLLSHDHHADNLDHAGRALLVNATTWLRNRDWLVWPEPPEKSDQAPSGCPASGTGACPDVFQPAPGTVFTTVEGAERLGRNSQALKPWQSVDLQAPHNRVLRLVGTPARHGPAGLERGAVTGFVLFFEDAPDRALYISGDTVWYEGVAEVAQRFKIRAAILHLGAARVPEVGPYHLTMTAAEGVQAAQAFADAAIVPIHFEGWAHFSEGRPEIAQAFATANLTPRLHWPEPGRPITIVL